MGTEGKKKVKKTLMGFDPKLLTLWTVAANN
jgi:hypothetical protein